MEKKEMKIELRGVTNNLTAIEDILENEPKKIKNQIKKNMKQFAQNCARVCYTQGDFADLLKEPFNEKFVEDLLKRGHHSVFEHINFTFNMIKLPKITAMILNNEKQYATSEKSARYTKMKDLVPEQKKKYDKWMEILKPEINNIYPNMKDTEKREEAIKKLAQENARYLTSVFTPTKMVHTINLRQLNFLVHCFKEFKDRNTMKNIYDQEMKKRLSSNLQELYKILKPLKIDGLENQTDRHLSLFNKRNVEEHFGDVYSTSYLMSFAGLAQAHRHRTINYHISEGMELDARLGFFIPKIIRKKEDLIQEWNQDLKEVSEKDYPQAQLLKVNERGILEDFRSKALLRMCGHAQHEIMENTKGTAERYKQYQKEYKNSLAPKCQQKIKCAGKCIWGGKEALERLI